MRRPQAIQPLHETSPVSTGKAEVQPTPAKEPQKTRAQRFAEAHAWVLEHHAVTFEKLAK